MSALGEALSTRERKNLKDNPAAWGMLHCPNPRDISTGRDRTRGFSRIGCGCVDAANLATFTFPHPGVLKIWDADRKDRQ